VAQDLMVCTSSSFTIPSAQDAGEGATYKWTVNGADVAGATGNSYTNTEGLATSGTYVYVRLAHTDDCGWQASNGYFVWCCDAPGSTVDFTAFKPCAASTGATWTLRDTRESSNNQSYKVKLMADGRYWMVQDLKFGDKCNKTSFAGSNGTDQTGKVTSHTDKTYYGDCRSNTYTGAGYLYDWAAAIQKPGAYCGGTEEGCSGTGGASCQGICPVGWHIPIGGSDGEFQKLHDAMNTSCEANNATCWNAASAWEGVFGGRCGISGLPLGQGDAAYYWSSTYVSNDNAYLLYHNNEITLYLMGSNPKNYGEAVRCVRNY
jgi:uncharacterized protein (TIGR02145 family)